LDGMVGTKVELRRYRMSNASSIYQWRHDPATTLWMGRRFRYLPTMDEVTASLGRVMEGVDPHAEFFAISHPASHEYLGGIDLTSIDDIDRNAVLSVVVGNGKHRGKGFGSEAISLLLGYAFRVRNLHKVSLTVGAENLPAVRCYQRVGFREEGRQRDHCLVHGRFSDLLMMSVLESEFGGA